MLKALDSTDVLRSKTYRTRAIRSICEICYSVMIPSALFDKYPGTLDNRILSALNDFVLDAHTFTRVRLLGIFFPCMCTRLMPTIKS